MILKTYKVSSGKGDIRTVKAFSKEGAAKLFIKEQKYKPKRVYVITGRTAIVYDNKLRRIL